MDPSRDLQKLGQQAYKHKNFHAALKFFNSVISSETTPSISVLDNRAATYEKLGDLQAALKDGRRMITDHKTSCAGYLRTAKILQLQEKHKAAADIYQYGLRNVPRNETNFKVPRSLEPVGTTQYLKSKPGLWTKLDFSAATKIIPRSAVQKYLNLSRCNANEVVISRFVAPQDRFLPHFARICRPLETLRIESGSPNESLIKAVSITENLRTLVLSRGCETTTDCVTQVLEHCPTLIQAEFHHIKFPMNGRHPPWPASMLKLQTLKLHLEEGSGGGGPGWVAAQRLSILSIDPLLERLPDVRQLSLTNWASRTIVPSPGKVEMGQLQKLELENYQGPMLLQSLPSLRSLALKSCPEIFKSIQAWTPKSDLRNAGLVGFSAPHTSNMELDTLLQLLGPETECLRHLDISHCRGLDSSDLAQIVRMGFINEVADLDLSGTEATDPIIELLVPRAQKLTRVRLAGTSITGISVKALVGKPDNKIVHLDIRDCCNVSSDAIAFARKVVGLTVQCGPMSIKHGKKMRFGSMWSNQI
ncbi:MAG: hypothetical protein Q9216_001967 [Gyalolechia sp. 2 TL-2023]